MNSYFMTEFRKKLKDSAIDFYITFSSDPHLSEYIDDIYNEKELFTKFKGSYGVVVVSADQLLLWTDSRYFIEAEELAAAGGFTLMKQGIDPSWDKWLDQQGLDSFTVGLSFSCTATNSLLKLREKKENCLVVNTDEIDDFLPREKPRHKNIFSLSKFPIVAQRLEYIRNEIFYRGKDNLMLLSALDDVAWLTNLRGSDIEFNPVFYSYLLVADSFSILFCDEQLLDEQDRFELTQLGIEIKPYSVTLLKEKILEIALDQMNIFFSKTSLNGELYTFLEELKGFRSVLFSDLSSFYQYKNIKTPDELELLRKAMICDGVALTLFYKSLLNSWELNEFVLGEKISRCREVAAARLGFRYFSESFEPISAWGPNGAIIHYKADPDKCARLSEPVIDNQLLLLDSGGQYSCGTTDVTRVFSLGKKSNQAIRDYSLVLKGHLALKHSIFPKDTPNSKLDTLARFNLWSDLKDYGHGTGHGVGFCLNVHEGPFGIRKNLSELCLAPGMVLTDEPGFYKKGEYGIRIENMLAVQSENDEFLSFEDLTLFPYDLDLIKRQILGKSNLAKVLEYHRVVYSRLNAFLSKKEKAVLKKYSKI
ncbi:MAG: M24 family metallopeptidase [Spirochaetales bacterium]|nr:M24 family metallopeptidase [Spirochaetales bacterium]